MFSVFGSRRVFAGVMVACAISLGSVPVMANSGQDVAQPEAQSTPEKVLTQFLRAAYSRNAAKAYDLLSTDDQAIKTREEYVKETAAFDGRSLMLAQALADGIEFRNLKADIQGTLATVTFDVTLPDANNPAIDELVHGFSRDKLAKLALDDVNLLAGQLRKDLKSGNLPVLRSTGETRKLVNEDGKWRVFENWAGAVEVNFSSFKFEGLSWEFVPTRTQVMAKHGETVHMSYRAKNVGSVETTSKARHVITPHKQASHLEIVQCFCFLEQTLAPGEEVELPLVFRVSYDAPEKVQEFFVKYEIYPFHSFPKMQSAAEGHSG